MAEDAVAVGGLLREVARRGRKADEARASFHETIRRAAEFAPQRAVAEAAGLSVTRVNQIIHGHSGN